MSIDDVLGALLDKVAEMGSEERSEHDQAYLRSDLEHLGVSVPDARKIAKWLLAEYPEVRADPWALVHAAWATGIFDVRSVLSFYLERATLGDDATTHLERILRDSHTWALVDQMAIHVLPRAKPDYATLARWATDDDFWLRRAALLADLKELRAGKGNPGRWANLAKPNLAHEDEFIRKALGWVLREIAKVRPEWTEKFVTEHKDDLSALTLREATRNLDA